MSDSPNRVGKIPAQEGKKEAGQLAQREAKELSSQLSPKKHNQEQWQQRYIEDTTGWDRGAASVALRQWLKTDLTSACHILVPGCGRGHEVVLLAEQGFTVTAVDFAPAAILFLESELSRRNLSAELLQVDILDYTFEHQFDAVYEQTCLCAIEPKERECYEQKLRDTLKDGGKLFALIMQTGRDGGPPYHCDMGEMKNLFSNACWKWPDGPYEEIPHHSGLFEYAVVLEKLPHMG